MKFDQGNWYDSVMPKHQRRARKRPYKVECRYIMGWAADPRTLRLTATHFTPWLRYSSYATEESREAGLVQLKKSHPNMEFRKV